MNFNFGLFTIDDDDDDDDDDDGDHDWYLYIEMTIKNEAKVPYQKFSNDEMDGFDDT